MTARAQDIGNLVLRVQDDFLETPGLSLTLPQARQRYGLDKVTCEAILAALVDAGVLANAHGTFFRFKRAA